MSDSPMHGVRRTRKAVLLAGLLGLGLGLPGGAVLTKWASRPQFEPIRAADPRSTGTLILCGGVTAPAVERRLVELAGGPKARIVVIPTAMTFEGSPDEASLTKPFRDLGAGSVRVLHTLSREEADDPGFSATIRQATGVWMTGGSQARLSRAYRGTRVEAELHALFGRGGVIGGSSAGAAVMSDIMIEGGRDEKDVAVGRGFDLLPESVVDMHFLERGRIQRLLKVLERNPGRYGLGIDAATALEYHAGTFRVLGRSYVMTLFPGPRGFRLDVLVPDEVVTLAEMKDDAHRSSLHALPSAVESEAEAEMEAGADRPEAEVSGAGAR
ncbi:MAG: cyanophycinase [Isosphaeraceae bacterium]